MWGAGVLGAPDRYNSGQGSVARGLTLEAGCGAGGGAGSGTRWLPWARYGWVLCPCLVLEGPLLGTWEGSMRAWWLAS